MSNKPIETIRPKEKITENKPYALTEFKCEYGLSAEINGRWYKFYTGAGITISENATSEQVAEAKDKAWNTCFSEIEKQINELRQSI